MGEAKRKREQFRKEPKPCIFCGEPGTTMDHVPPKSMFVSPRPALITVPACERCNTGSSALDEQFKVFLSLRVGPETPAAKEFWEKGALRSINANLRLKREILDGPPVFVPGPDGRLHQTVAVKWNAPSHDRTIEKITRGLYWHHFREPLPYDAAVRTYYFNGLGEDLQAFAMSVARGNIGGHERFGYAFARWDGDGVFSVWLYQFYRGHWAGAFTTPADHDWHGSSEPAVLLKEVQGALAAAKKAGDGCERA